MRDKITRILVDNELSTEQRADALVKLVNGRTLWSNQDISDYIGRERAIWATWYAKGRHDLPGPAYVTRVGGLWDADDVRTWARDHAELVARGSHAQLDACVGHLISYAGPRTPPPGTGALSCL